MAFVVAATWRAKPGEAERVAAVIRTMTPLSRAEPGNLFYQAQVSPEEPETFFLYEQYVDAEAYEDHKASPHFQEHVVGDALERLAERTVRTYRTVD
jgi:quinol monooxygenase YgiN